MKQYCPGRHAWQSATDDADVELLKVPFGHGNCVEYSVASGQ